ncbi:MAG: pilus assembly protein PilP [Desulfohalobiaceae bacterium]
MHSSRHTFSPKAAGQGPSSRSALWPGPGLLWLCLWLLLLYPACLQAEAESPEQDSQPEWIQPTSFEYSPEGKPDPFLPFIDTQEQDQEPSSSKQQPQRILTPLERVQPRQLNLVGVLWDPEQPEQAMAMVELPNGKGYVLRQGTKVGDQQGRVINISPSQVLIQEKTKTVTGQEETRDVVLKLQPSAGDKNE